MRIWLLVSLLCLWGVNALAVSETIHDSAIHVFPGGIRPGDVKCASLAGLSAKPGTERWCIDCTSGSDPCTCGGTGANAVRVGSTWVCGGGGGGSQGPTGPTGATGATGPTGPVEVVNLEDYGIVCDGVTDTTAAIRAGMAAVPPTGSRVILPPQADLCIVAPSGIQPMIPIVTSNTTLHCEPGSGFKIKDNSLVALASGNFSGEMIGNRDASATLVPVDRVTVEDCFLDGNDTNNPQPGSVEAIAFRDATNLTIQRNYLHDITYIGIATFNGRHHKIIDNFIFNQGQTVNSDAIQSNGSQHVAISRNLINNFGEGIFVQHSTSSPSLPFNRHASRHVSVLGNVLVNYLANEVCTASGIPFACCTGEGTGSSTGDCALGHSGGSSIGLLAQDSSIIGNVIQHAAQISVQSGRDKDTRNVLIEGNNVNKTIITGDVDATCVAVITLGSCSAAGRNPGLGCTTDANCQKCQGGSNDNGTTCADDGDCPGGGVCKLGTCDTFALEDIDIKGNNLTDCGLSGVFVRPTLGQSVDRLTIQGNTILRPCTAGGTCAGIFFDQPTSENVVDARITENRVVDGGRYGLWLLGDETNLEVSNNEFQNNTSGKMNLATGSTITTWRDNGGLTRAELTVLTGKGVQPGSREFCTNCQGDSVCSTGGTGRWAVFQDGDWTCSTPIHLGSNDGTSSEIWAITGFSKNQLVGVNKLTNVTVSSTATGSCVGNDDPSLCCSGAGAGPCITIATPSTIFQENEWDADGAFTVVTAATDILDVVAIASTGILPINTLASTTAFYASAQFRSNGPVPGTITVDARYDDGAGGTTWHTITTASSNGSQFWVSGPLTLTGIASPFSFYGVRWSFTDWSGTGVGRMLSLGIHHKSEVAFPNALRRDADTRFPMLGSIRWAASLGAINHVQGPDDQTLGITAGSGQGVKVTGASYELAGLTAGTGPICVQSTGGVLSGAGASCAAGATEMWWPAAVCGANVIGDTSEWGLTNDGGSVGTPGISCTAGSNGVNTPTLQFDPSTPGQTQHSWMIPTTWTSMPKIDVTIKWFSASTTGDVVWQLSTICVADGEIENVAYNTAQAIVDTVKGTANQTNDAVQTNITTTGCAPGELMHVKLYRDGAHASDTLNSIARFLGMQLRVYP